MRLLELHIDGFGKFHDRTISFNDGINIIYGKNEAGKSTLHTFIRGMLYGYERISCLLDNDDAGRKATLAIRRCLKKS